MGTNSFGAHQHLVGPLATGSGSLRGSIGAGELLAHAARRLLETGAYTRSQRQRLHDMTRACRMAATDRSSFGTFLELAPLAPLDVSLTAIERLCVEIVARGLHPLPPRDVANRHEEQTNHVGNLAQLRFGECMSPSALYDLTDAMGQQREASRVLALAEAAHVSRLISIPN